MGASLEQGLHALIVTMLVAHHDHGGRCATRRHLPKKIERATVFEPFVNQHAIDPVHAQQPHGLSNRSGAMHCHLGC